MSKRPADGSARRYAIDEPIPPAPSNRYESETARALRTIGVLLLVLAFIVLIGMVLR
jgi:hypothetical protein